MHPSGIIGPNDFSSSHLTQLIIDFTNGRLKRLPMWLAKLTAPLSEIYYTVLKQTPLYTKYSLYTLNTNSNFSNEKAKKELGYKNRELKQTIEDTISWLIANNRIN